MIHSFSSQLCQRYNGERNSTKISSEFCFHRRHISHRVEQNSLNCSVCMCEPSNSSLCTAEGSPPPPQRTVKQSGEVSRGGILKLLCISSSDVHQQATTGLLSMTMASLTAAQNNSQHQFYWFLKEGFHVCLFLFTVSSPSLPLVFHLYNTQLMRAGQGDQSHYHPYRRHISRPHGPK